MNEYMVKGSSIKSKFEFVAERFGPKAEADLAGRLHHHNIFPILDSDWYPFSLYDEINVEIARMFYRGNLKKLTEVGEYSAQKTLTTLYKSYIQGKDFVRFLKRLALLHQRYYNMGEMDIALGQDQRSCTITLKGAPSYTEPDSYIAAGFYVRAAKLCGLNKVSYDLRHDPSQVQFVITWS